MIEYGPTCDECQHYNLCSGLCKKHNVYRHSCGEDACDDFILADDLKEMDGYDDKGRNNEDA